MTVFVRNTSTILRVLILGILVVGMFAGCSPAPQAPESPVPMTVTPARQPASSPQPTGEPELIEEHTVEMEWPQGLSLGDSDVIRLTLRPHQDGYLVEAEFAEHQTQQREIFFERPAGYDLFGAARLEGVSFDITPAGNQIVQLLPGDSATWYWSLTAKAAGQQRLALTLALQWVDRSSGSIARETQVFSRAVNVQVTSPLTVSGRMLQIGLGLLSFILLVIIFRHVRHRQDANQPILRSRPSRQVVLERIPGLQLSKEHAHLLTALFSQYARLMVNREFLSGYSGARTFLIQPVRADGRSDAHTIAKVGSQKMIEREYQNYETFVKDTLPPLTARIQHAPVTIKGSSLAAVRYTFLGDAGQVPASLRQVLLADPDGDYLRRLSDTFGPNWWRQNSPYAFRAAQEYDRLLPAHLVLKPAVQRGVRWLISEYLDERMQPEEIPAVAIGAKVPLRKFTQAELRADGKSLSLRGLVQSGQHPLRITWLSSEKPAVGTLAEVVATRQSILHLVSEGLQTCGLNDPLSYLPEALQTAVNGTQSIIHGDLNLENILVGPGGLLWLIDFANTRQGHTLADFAHLEAELIVNILRTQVENPKDFVHRLENRQFPLLVTLHEIASEYMANPSDPQEYDLAVYMSCIGGLKYTNLDQDARQLLFLAAAYLSGKLKKNSRASQA
jgi:hypothetical protein